MTPWWAADAVTISQAVRNREVSATEVVADVLAHTKTTDADLHAMAYLGVDEAYEQAHAVDLALAAGRDPGPLAGVPVTVKDVLFTKDMPTAAGHVPYRDFLAGSDDLSVARLRRAGAVVIGKTAVYELAYGPSDSPQWPAVRNPWRTDLTSGGSSSGAAVAVAAGMGPIAVGTDGGGSIRCPASFCGIVGLKPSRGRIPVLVDSRYPGLSSWGTLGHIGPMARTVADTALALDVMTGPDPRVASSLPAPGPGWLTVPETELRQAKVCYSRDWGYAVTDPAVLAQVDEVVERLSAELATPIAHRDPKWVDPAPLMPPLIAADADLQGMRDLIARTGVQPSASIAAMLSREWTAEELTEARQGTYRLVREMAGYLDGFDLLITPTMAVLPFPAADPGPVLDGRLCEDIARWAPFTFPMNLTGQPAISVPAGWTADGVPVGVQIVGRQFGDALVLRFAQLWEQLSPWRHLRPPAADPATEGC
ncbi:amidase [Amycolatopsis jejuensis]|uniref:amidase n=1 Tax=Amycolatopsis jejuensis TaxID=330084 RepID=UPI000525C514|nr:amidase family protein [Amycolatopsis jejuensis]